MRTMFALVALLAAFSDGRTACAQGLFGLTAPRPSDLPVAPGKGATADPYSAAWSHFRYSSLSSVRSSIVGPSLNIPVSRVTFFYLAPLAVTPSQPVAIIPQPWPNREENRQVERVPPPSLPEVEAPAVPEKMAPGAPASVFRPIRPEDRARASVPTVAEPSRPAQPALPSRPEREKAPPQREPLPLPGAPAIPAEPKTASARHIESGKEAFKARQYSRAERSFRRAAESVPDDAPAHFLLAQARFALGKYAEAVAAIYAGMRVQPNWPNARYRPRDSYGADGDDFSDQLKRLADALAKNPDDPFLTFLRAYQLWFDNRKDEARLLFQRGKTLTSDPSFIERFLQANPGSAVDDAVVELFPPGPRF